MRALLAVAALSAGCDQLFQINRIDFGDAAVPHDIAAGSADAAATDPTLLGYGQQAYSDTSPSSMVVVTLDGQYDLGTLIVIAVCEASAVTGLTVTDGDQTKYSEAVTAAGMVASPILTSQLYYGILAASVQQPRIEVDFTDAVFGPDVRVAAYANISTFTSFESASEAGVMGASSATTSVAVDTIPSLLVAATCVANNDQTLGIDGFHVRTVTQPNGDALADTVTRDIGAATATARQNAMSGMIVQLAAFKGIPAR